MMKSIKIKSGKIKPDLPKHRTTKRAETCTKSEKQQTDVFGLELHAKQNSNFRTATEN
jgi:hypothetical protein